MYVCTVHYYTLPFISGVARRGAYNASNPPPPPGKDIPGYATGAYPVVSVVCELFFFFSSEIRL
ncbi:unnamed protein product [Ixodes pacificus]